MHRPLTLDDDAHDSLMFRPLKRRRRLSDDASEPPHADTMQAVRPTAASPAPCLTQPPVVAVAVATAFGGDHTVTRAGSPSPAAVSLLPESRLWAHAWDQTRAVAATCVPPAATPLGYAPCAGADMEDDGVGVAVMALRAPSPPPPLPAPPPGQAVAVASAQNLLLRSLHEERVLRRLAARRMSQYSGGFTGKITLTTAPTEDVDFDDL
jgi:hypothetical protein